MPKSTQTRKGGYKSESKYTKPYRPCIFSQEYKDVEMGLCMFAFTCVYPPSLVCVHFGITFKFCSSFSTFLLMFQLFKVET